MITNAVDIADLIKACNALWRSLYAVAPIHIAAKKVPITIRYEFNVSIMDTHNPPQYQRTYFRSRDFHEGG
jgi:hypothetical protein